MRSTANAGDNARASTLRSSKPALAPVQVRPASSERRMPSVSVPASSTTPSRCSSVAAARLSTRLPTRTCCQTSPASVERYSALPALTKTVRSVANRGEGRTTSANGRLAPAPGKLHIRPLSNERYTPTCVAANRTAPPSPLAMARLGTLPSVRSATRSQAWELPTMTGCPRRVSDSPLQEGVDCDLTHSGTDAAGRIFAADEDLGGQGERGGADAGLQRGQRYRERVDNTGAPGVHPGAADHVEHRWMLGMRAETAGVVNNRARLESRVARDRAYRLGQRVGQRGQPNRFIATQGHRLGGGNARQQRGAA